MVGNAKNAGKTTVLNALAASFPEAVLGLSSIGLDGEELDLVSQLPKPQVHVSVGTLVGIAEGCLAQSATRLEVLTKTGVMTAMGEVLIARAAAAGACLLGGPSTVEGMEKVMRLLQAHGASRLFIDGAFARQSHAAVGEGLVYVVGAHKSPFLQTVVDSAALALRRLSLPAAPPSFAFLWAQRRPGWLDTAGQFTPLGLDDAPIDLHEALDRLPSQAAWLYLPGFVDKAQVTALVARRRQQHGGLITRSPLSLVMEDSSLKKLFRLGLPIQVLKPARVAFVAINPVSPGAHQFDAAAFQAAMAAVTDLPLINVLED